MPGTGMVQPAGDLVIVHLGEPNFRREFDDEGGEADGGGVHLVAAQVPPASEI